MVPAAKFGADDKDDVEEDVESGKEPELNPAAGAVLATATGAAGFAGPG